MHIKKFQDLTLADDFMFGEVYEKDKIGVRFCLRSFSLKNFIAGTLFLVGAESVFVSVGSSAL